MSEDYFDVAWINNDRCILFGMRADESVVERNLSRDDMAKVMLLEARQRGAMQKLLRELAA